jgi:hypothetical protein
MPKLVGEPPPESELPRIGGFVAQPRLPARGNAAAPALAAINLRKFRLCIVIPFFYCVSSFCSTFSKIQRSRL